MNMNPQNPRVPMPVSKPLEVLKTPAIEEDIEKLQFRTTPTTDSGVGSDAPRSAERESVDKNKAAIDGCLRTGEVMKALFPEGLQLKDEEEFAIFRLFDRLVGDIATFAQTGMTRQASLRDLSLHAMLLEKMIASKDKA